MRSREQKIMDNVERVELWLKAPLDNKPDMEPGMAEYLERVRLAHKWLHKHGSIQKVATMLVTHHREAGKTTYSEATARRDLQDAQRLFHTITPDTGRFFTGFMLDRLCAVFDSAVLAHKHKEAAQTALVIAKYLEMAQKYAVLDLERLDQPVPKMIQFSPEEAGVEYDPQVLRQVEIWRQKRDERKRLQDGRFFNATDAEPLST